MSDFLSKFTRDQYADMVKKEEKEKAEGTAPEEAPRSQRLPDNIEDENGFVPEPPVRSAPQVAKEPVPETPAPKEPVITEPEDLPEEPSVEEKMTVQDVESTGPPPVGPPSPPKESNKSRRVPPPARHTYADEETVIDPSYKDKQRRKYIILAAVGVLLLLLLAFGIYRFMHVKVPDFTGKNVSEARVWGAQNRIDFVLDQVHSKDYGANIVISQSDTANKMVRKGTSVTLVTSLGPDPEEVIPLPDFETYSAEQAREWAGEQQANNFSVVNQYSDTVEQGRFISLNITDKNVTPESYKRKDTAIAYFSRGPEVFEKNIVVPDFTGKQRAEVETWANTNSMKLTIKETTSNAVDAGFVISQSVVKGEKVAKNDPFEITVSLGQAIIVPDFHDYHMGNAAEVTGVTPVVHTRYSELIPYGKLISQSLMPGTKLSDKDNKSMVVVYSLGLPYLKDLRLETNEGDLQKYFFDEFQSKGANVTYTVRYVESHYPKGTVISQSTYESLIPLTFNVQLSISLGDGTSIDPDVKPPPGKEKD